MANLPTTVAKDAAITPRALEVPAADFTNGCNIAAECAPGFGIATDNAGLEKSLPNWTLLDQDGDVRDPQHSQHLGGAGYVNRSSVPWSSSGGAEGKGTDILDCATMPTQAAKDADHEQDGTVGAVDGQALLQDLALGWVSGTPTP
jgi:hypothetical protein